MKRWLRGRRRGAVAVETALVASLLLVPLTAGALDLGVALSVHGRMDQAIQAASLYAWANAATLAAGGSGWQSGVQQAAQAAWGASAPTLSVAPSLSCFCLTGTETRINGAAAACGGSCETGSLSTYLSLAVSTSVAMPVGTSLFANPLPLSSTAIVRVQ